MDAMGLGRRAFRTFFLETQSSRRTEVPPRSRFSSTAELGPWADPPLGETEGRSRGHIMGSPLSRWSMPLRAVEAAEDSFLQKTYWRYPENVTEQYLSAAVSFPAMSPHGLPLAFLEEAIREAGDRVVKRLAAVFHIAGVTKGWIRYQGEAVRPTLGHRGSLRRQSATCDGRGR